MGKGFSIVFVVLIVALIFCVYLMIMISISYNAACKEIGFEEYKVEGNFRFCEDLDGNLHYIKVECVLPPFTKCIVKPISVGDVRIKGGD